jgi:multidrug efflux pump subunit AcrB
MTWTRIFGRLLRSFAIVIAGGLISDLVMSIFLLPTLHVWIARDCDVLPPFDSLHFDDV